MIKHLVWAISIIAISTSALGRTRRPLVTLSLQTAIKRAIAGNRDLKTQRLALRSAEITYNQAWFTMWMPQISLSFSSSNSKTIGQVGGSSAKADGKSVYNPGYPTSEVSLSLGAYTLFNFGRDLLTYDAAKLTWTRAKEQQAEFVRSLKADVTKQYFQLKTELEKLDAADRSVKIARAILELTKSRRRIGKASTDEVNSSSVDLLSAQNQYNDQITVVREALWALNNLLGDNLGTRYRLTDQIRFLPLRLSLRSATQIYIQNSPEMKDQVLAMKTAEMDLERAEKDRLPLPQVTFSGLTLSYGNGYYGGTRSTSTGSSPDGNVNISAGISLTIPLLGPEGVFNRYTVENTRIARDTQEISVINQRITGKTSVFNSWTSIRQQEKSIRNNQIAFKQNVAVLDNIFAKVSKRKVSRLELRDAIQQVRESEFTLKDSLNTHLGSKLDLGVLIGVDRLPGDSR